MTKKGVRLLALGSLVVFFILITSSDLGSLEQEKFKVLSSRLIILDEPPESDQEYEVYRYDEAKKGYVVVYAAMVGYIDSKDTEYFPWFNISLRDADNIIIRVDFKCSITAKVTAFILANGPGLTALLDEPEELSVKKNVYYRAEFEVDTGGAPLGIYDLIAMIYPSDNFINKFVGGGSSVATARFEFKK